MTTLHFTIGTHAHPARTELKTSDGLLVSERQLPCYSSNDKTPDDAINCVHFKPDTREQVAAMNADYINTVERIVAAFNACQGLTLEQLRNVPGGTFREGTRALFEEAENLQAQLDEADRRAGAAERRLYRANETIAAHDESRRQMKEQAGFDDRTSFDVVWAKVMDVYQKHRQATGCQNDANCTFKSDGKGGSTCTKCGESFPF